MREEGLVFACQCSRTQLQNGSECHCREMKLSLDALHTSWRLITDEETPLTVRTMDDFQTANLLPECIKWFVVRKKNGLPSYQLSSLTDDEYFGIDAIVRGQDLWNSTLAQQYLALKLNKNFFQDIIFCHHPLIMDANAGNKLSKSAGANSVQHFIKAGKTREDIIKVIEELMPGWV